MKTVSLSVSYECYQFEINLFNFISISINLFIHQFQIKGVYPQFFNAMKFLYAKICLNTSKFNEVKFSVNILLI